MTNSLVYMTDPAHGWLRVPLAMIAGEKYSEYSYYNNRYAYLEEDCDMPKFLSKHPNVDTAQFVTQYFDSREAFYREVRSQQC